MTLERLIENLFVREDAILPGVALAGTLNIETGFAEFKSKHFVDCESCIGSTTVVVNCTTCGRTTGNNVRFLAGRGDGVYSGITLLADDGVLACVYVFDENNQMAEAILPQLNGETLLGNNFQITLIESIAEYLELPAFELGKIQATFNDTRDVGFVAADVQSGSRKFATVDHPLATGSFSVYLFMEPILDSPSAALVEDKFLYDRGYSEAMRPRVALIVKKDFESLLMRGVEIKEADWTKQLEVWNETLVMSNGVGGNDGVSNLYNGLFWIAAARDQHQVMGESDEMGLMEYLYGTRAFGYFIMGALCGDEDARDMASLQLAKSPELLDESIISDVLEPRGLKMSEEIVSLLDVKTSQEGNMKNNFCTSCGKKFDDRENFCAECGTKRN